MGLSCPNLGMLLSVSLVAMIEETIRTSSRNTSQGKARRRAERERRRRSMPSGQGPGAVDAPSVQVAPRPERPGPRIPDEHDPGVPPGAGGDVIAAEPGEADLETNADPGDFGDLDPDDADLQATLTVLAVLADDIIGDIVPMWPMSPTWPTIWLATPTSRRYRTGQKTSGTLRRASRPPGGRRGRGDPRPQMTRTTIFPPRGWRSPARRRTRSRTT